MPMGTGSWGEMGTGCGETLRKVHPPELGEADSTASPGESPWSWRRNGGARPGQATDTGELHPAAWRRGGEHERAFRDVGLEDPFEGEREDEEASQGPHMPCSGPRPVP